MVPQKIWYVTGNTLKFQEVANCFAEHNAPLILEQTDLDTDEPQTLDMLKITVTKARAAWNQLQAPALVDDSGIYFEKYHNFPGVMTKFLYQAIGIEGLTKLVDAGDKAEFRIIMAYVWGPNDDQIKFFTASCPGTIVMPDPSRSIDNHYPYDVIFKPNGSELTYDQLRSQPSGRTQFSYRIQAAQKFLQWYLKQN